MRFSILDIFFPALCLNCQQPVENGAAVCPACFQKIPVFNNFFCGRCGARRPVAANQQFPQKICHQSFPYILGAAGDYQNEVLKNLVRGLKFQLVKDAAKPLAELLAVYVQNLSLSFLNFLIMPIPLGKKRLKERGFNQAELIAGIFAERLGLPSDNGNLIRSKNTRPQSELKNFSERHKNVKNIFSLRYPELVKDKKIILLDDVVTSGTTFLEAAQVLKNAGAKKIVALAAAKA